MGAIKLSHVSILTPCKGSWDGENLTACELLGRPGETGFFFDLLHFSLTNTLYSNTGRRDSIDVNLESNGSLTFRNSLSEYNSLHHPFQFAYWQGNSNSILVGIEDLDGTESIGSDYDYNDLILRYAPKEPTFFHQTFNYTEPPCFSSIEDELGCQVGKVSVPEPGGFSLILIAFLFIGVFRWITPMNS